MPQAVFEDPGPPPDEPLSPEVLTRIAVDSAITQHQLVEWGTAVNEAGTKPKPQKPANTQANPASTQAVAIPGKGVPGRDTPSFPAPAATLNTTPFGLMLEIAALATELLPVFFPTQTSPETTSPGGHTGLLGIDIQTRTTDDTISFRATLYADQFFTDVGGDPFVNYQEVRSFLAANDISLYYASHDVSPFPATGLVFDSNQFYDRFSK